LRGLATSGSIEDVSEKPGQAPEQALSVLEDALRAALAAASPEQVMRAVQAMFPAKNVEIDTSRFHGRVQKVSVSMPEELTAAIRERTGPGGFSRFVSEAAEKRLRNELIDAYLDELDEVFGPVPAELMDQARREWPDYEEE
jgi:Arc/MetJ-type ribon-helix-helix transcriptional regulator